MNRLWTFMSVSVSFLSVHLSLGAQVFELLEEVGFAQGLSHCTGVAVADYDQDGDLDVFLVATEVFDEDHPNTWSRLYRNDGEMQFTDVTLTSKLINFQAVTREGTMGAQMGASWGDYDNDGYPDLFISNYGLDELWHNEGDGTFRNVTEETGIAGCLYCYSMNGTWWDYDQDGDLDLYVSDWLKDNRLYRNDGDHTFTDISMLTGLNDNRHTFSSLPIDINQDGRLDLYVINDIGPNKFYWNLGNDEFLEAADEIGLFNIGNGMGVDVCDYNNDGRFDIYLTNIFEYVPNPFFVNQETGTFSDRAQSLGIDDTGWGWGARFFDADHDLDEDLYVVNGFFSPIAAADSNRFFKFQDDRYIDVSADLGLASPVIGMGLEVFDCDQDGDLDMLVGNRLAPIHFYQNRLLETFENSNWIQIRLEGTGSNRNGFGAVVKIILGSSEYYRYHSGVNLFSQSIKPVHFGLGNQSLVDQILISWPSGLRETFASEAANQIITLIEGTGEPVPEETIVSTFQESFDGINLFPNPFYDKLYLRLNEPIAGDIQLYLFDAVGRRITQRTFADLQDTGPDIQIPIEGDINPGLYFYALSSEGKVKCGKLLKATRR